MEQETHSTGSGQAKQCQNCKQEFAIEPEDFDFYEKMKVPAPTFCPDCRSVRRMLWRNERGLYKSTCGLCGSTMISMYDPKKKLIIYCDKCWWGDRWDPMEYGLKYDFNEPFFVQWKKLLRKVPLIQAWRFNNVDSDYMNYGTECRNCYLSSSVTFCENVSYSYAIDKGRDILDSSFVNKSDWCYENIDSRNSYNSVYLENCSDCMDSGFLFDCINCQNCFLSSNLRNKKYVLRNRQYTEAEYRAKMLEINTGDFDSMQKMVNEFSGIKKDKSIHKYINSVNSVNYSGNDIENSKNTNIVFNAINSEDIKYAFRINGCKDCNDIMGAIKAELAYDSIAPNFDGSRTKFSISNRVSDDISYCFYCSSSSHLFGCIGLRNKQYCIFNKQYTKEEYEELVPKIIQHMNEMPYVDGGGITYKYGEFFPGVISPFSYNETIAQEYSPLTMEEALKQGYAWKEKEGKNYAVEINSANIPATDQAGEDVVGKVIECMHKGKCNDQCAEAFKIVLQEFQFYKKMNLPLPRLCPNCRHCRRLAQRNPLKLWRRQCMCKKQNHSHDGVCEVQFETSYSPESLETVYCESCYQKEVI